MSNRLEQIINLKLNNFEIKIPKKLEIEPNPCWEGYEPIGLKDDGSPNCVPIKEEQSKVIDFADYPWDACIEDQIKAYGDEETAKKVCGAIKAGMRQEGFVIPEPSGDEDEQTFVSRCIAAIYDEYGQEQSAAICYEKWSNK